MSAQSVARGPAPASERDPLQAAWPVGVSRPRILSAIVVPPHLTASGGASAAEDLSAALTQHCDMTVASMMPAPLRPPHGDDQAVRLRVESYLPALMPWSKLPQGARSLFYRSDIAAQISPARYDLVHLHNPMPAFEFARIAATCRRQAIPYVISTHGFNEIANGERIYGFGAARRSVWRHCVSRPIRRAVQGAAGIFALSPADVPLVRAMGFSGPITQVPNGVAPAIPGDPAVDAQICAAFGIPAERHPGQITCMFLANHTPNKGLPILFEAMAQLDVPYLLIVGGETRPSVDYEAATRTRRPDQRIVVTGRLTDDAVSALLRRADVFVFPTLADTFPLVVLEAMAQGLPVVASDLGGIPHQVGSCGLLVRPGDPRDLADGIETLARDPARRRFMGRSAKQRVATSFTWDHAAICATEGYAAVLARGRASPERTLSAVRGTPSFPR